MTASLHQWFNSLQSTIAWKQNNGTQWAQDEVATTSSKYTAKCVALLLKYEHNIAKNSGNVKRAIALQPTSAISLCARFESMSFVVNILACKLKIVNNRN